MGTKSIIYISMFVFSTIGSFIPSLWGDNFLSLSSMLLTVLGGLVGIWVGYKISR